MFLAVLLMLGRRGLGGVYAERCSGPSVCFPLGFMALLLFSHLCDQSPRKGFWRQIITLSLVWPVSNQIPLYSEVVIKRDQFAPLKAPTCMLQTETYVKEIKYILHCTCTGQTHFV